MRRFASVLIFVPALSLAYSATGSNHSTCQPLVAPIANWSAWHNEISRTVTKQVADSLKSILLSPEFTDSSFRIHFLHIAPRHLNLAVVQYEYGIGFATNIYRIEGRNAHLLQEFDGYVWGIKKDSATELPSFHICKIPGGDATQYAITEFVSSVIQGDLHFNPVRHFVWHMDTGFPTKTITKEPITFAIHDQVCNLRTKPRIDNSVFSSEEYAPGNIFAIYAPNSVGTILDKTTDRTGRIWYLVVMSTPPLQSRAYPERDECPIHIVGWISAKYLALAR